MYISKINSAINSNSQSFGSEQERPKLKRLSDDDIYTIASYGPKQRFSKVAKNVTGTVLIGIPLAAGIFSGLAKRGNLSTRLSASAKELGNWALIIASGTVLMGMKRFINNRIEKLDNFDKKHGIVSFGIDFAALYGILALMKKAGSNLKSSITKHMPSQINWLKTTVKEPMKKRLNSSFVSEYAVKPLENFMTKHPHYEKTTGIMAALAVPVIGIASITRLLSEAKSAARNTDYNYNRLQSINQLLPANENVIEEN